MQQYGPEGEAEGGRGEARVGVGGWGGGGEAGRGLVKMWKGWSWAQRGSRWGEVESQRTKRLINTLHYLCVIFGNL